MENKPKKGLVVIYDPHSLQQFIWYMCTISKDVKWDALCLPNDNRATYMDTYCRKSGVFDRVFVGHTNYMRVDLHKKLILFMKMLAYFIVGKRDLFCKKILNEYVEDIDRYSELASICDSGFVCGMFATLGKEKTVSYFDDGAGDYEERKKWTGQYKTGSMEYWQGLLLTKMGYSCKGRFYFEPTKYCNKYSAITSRMKYTNYKHMYDMSMENTDMERYQEILGKTYPELNEYDFSNAEVILFTDNMKDLSPNAQVFNDKCVDYISRKYKSVLIKRHPRDEGIYHFGEDVKVQEIDRAIPAEVFLDRLQGKKIFFIYATSLILFMQQYGYEYELLYSEELYEERKNIPSCTVKMFSKRECAEYCDRYTKGAYQITTI